MKQVFGAAAAGFLVFAVATTTAGAAAPSWPGFQIIEWQPRSPAQLATLRGLGVTAGMAMSARHGNIEAVRAEAAVLRAAGLGCYVENIATDFYSPYHRWTPDHPVNWQFTEAQNAYRENPKNTAFLNRTPSLSDAAWRARIADRLAEHVRAMRPFAPLFFNLADESGIADLAAFWDFDFSPASLAGFRAWLRTQYGSLPSLNAEWNTAFKTWEEVTPWTTREAMRAAADNLARWADFKAWMDVSFADAVRAGTDAVHRADPEARAALEGGQVPGWGGYDYALLSRAVDVMEMYDSDENLAIARSFNPDLVPLITTFRADRPGLRAIWRSWLRGARGLVLWDDAQDIVQADATIGSRGQAYAPVFAALRGSLGASLAASSPVYDPIVILYSPASFRIQWMLENRPRGDAWMESGSEADAQGVATRTALADYAHLLTRMGLRPRYASDRDLATESLGDARILILPHAVALSDAEITSIQDFVHRGGRVIADVSPGDYDAHGKRRWLAPSLSGVRFVLPGDAAGFQRSLGSVSPALKVHAAAEIYVFQDEGRLIVGLLPDPSNADQPTDAQVSIPRPMKATDLRSGRLLGAGRDLQIRLDPVMPTLIALTPE